MYYNGTIMNVNSSTTILTFTAPSLPDDVFTGTVVVMVTAVNRYGVGPASDPAIAIIYGQYLYIGIAMYLCIDIFTYIVMYVATYVHRLNFMCQNSKT